MDMTPQQRYAARMRDSGYVGVMYWIPRTCKTRMAAYARILREHLDASPTLAAYIAQLRDVADYLYTHGHDIEDAVDRIVEALESFDDPETIHSEGIDNLDLFPGLKDSPSDSP